MSNIRFAVTWPIFRLIAFNLSWHAKKMHMILYRYKILLLFMCLIVATSFYSFLQIISFPAMYILNNHNDIQSYIFSVIGYQVIAIVWIYIQAKVLNDTQWHNYLVSLPLKKWKLILNDFAVICIVDGIIWIPLFLTAAMKIMNGAPKHMALITGLFRVLITMLQLLFVQLAFYKRKFIIASVLFFLNLFCVINYIDCAQYIKVLSLLIWSLVAACLVLKCYQPARPIHSPFVLRKPIRNINIKSSYFSKIRINLISVNLVSYADAAILLAKLSFPFIIMATFRNFYHKYDWLNVVFVCINFFGLFIISNLYAEIHREKSNYYNYISSLPLRYSDHLINDCLLVIGMSLVYYSLIIFSSILLLTPSFTDLFIQIILAFIYSAAVYYPQRHFEKYGSFIALLMMFSFVYLYFFLLY